MVEMECFCDTFPSFQQPEEDLLKPIERPPMLKSFQEDEESDDEDKAEWKELSDKSEYESEENFSDEGTKMNRFMSIESEISDEMESETDSAHWISDILE